MSAFTASPNTSTGRRMNPGGRHAGLAPGPTATRSITWTPDGRPGLEALAADVDLIVGNQPGQSFVQGIQ
jgi:hypothetical protein